MLVRGSGKGNVFDCVFHRQKAVARLLNADITSPLCAKVIVPKQDKLLIKQAGGSPNPGKLWKGGDHHRTFAGAREDLDFASFCDDQGCRRLTDEGGRLERFIGSVS